MFRVAHFEQLALISQETSTKLEYLKAAREKISRAVDINPKAQAEDKTYAILEVSVTHRQRAMRAHARSSAACS